MGNRKFALGVQSDSVPVRTNFQLVLTLISHSTCIFWSLVNSPNLNHLRTQCEWELAHKVKTESSDASFGLDAPSVEGTSRVSETPSGECLLSGRTVRQLKY